LTRKLREELRVLSQKSGIVLELGIREGRLAAAPAVESLVPSAKLSNPRFKT